MKKFLIIFSGVVSIFIILIAIFLGYNYFKVSSEVSEEIRKGIVKEVYASESPVYYDDGNTVLGVFFEKTHQKYVHFKDFPEFFIQALIATEDQRFFHHYGFDVISIIRAAISNLKAGKIVQGGSTITQQTAKNLFRRHNRSYSAKFRELLQAICLERHFTKEELLELYSNQFYVTGAGRGIGIAAKYFFNKEIGDLNLVESAFIVGAIKGPNLFNPFTKRTEDAKRDTLLKAKNRKDYVLLKMFEMGFIGRDQFEEAKRTEVPFQGGKITYELNVILDYIQKQLQTDYFRNIFHDKNIDNISTSGIKIYTSINKEMQDGALESLRRNLSLLDIKVTGYDRNSITAKYEQILKNGIEEQKSGIPVLGRITDISIYKDKPRISVTWDKGEGIIDFEKTRPFFDAWAKSKNGNWATFEKQHLPVIHSLFQRNDPVAIQIMENEEELGQTSLLLTKIPEMQGGIVVIKDGKIKAMVGGYFNHFLNRAVDSKRQLGSIFKPIVYTAALQLKWNNLDPLMNVKNLFRFEDTYYIPKPDHNPVSDKVSMVWAGVKSENLASVWLAYHLIDKLNAGEFRSLVKLVGLEINEGETFHDYKQRLRDKWGIIITDDILMETAFEESKKEIETDLIFNGQEILLDTLSKVFYKVDQKNLTAEPEDASLVLRMSFKRLQSINKEMKRRLKEIKELSKNHEILSFSERENLGMLLAGFSFEGEGVGGENKVIFESKEDLNNLSILNEEIISALKRVHPENIWIDNLIPSSMLDYIQTDMERKFSDLKSDMLSNPDVIFKIRDFRTLIGLLYLVRLSGEMGISTKLDPVLSFPLGANAISIIEAALAYQTMMTGMRFTFTGIRTAGMVPVITKITDRYNETIWEYIPRKEKILSDRISALISEILRLVVEEGTGQSVKNTLRGSLVIDDETIDFPIPVYGKTGTSNDYTNSSFIGFIPGPSSETGKLERSEGYVIASYVGYDDNRPMKSKNITIYGSSGALPMWLDTAKSVANSRDYNKGLELADIIFDDQNFEEHQKNNLIPVMISRKDGMPIGKKRLEIEYNDNPWVLTDGTLISGSR